MQAPAIVAAYLLAIVLTWDITTLHSIVYEHKSEAAFIQQENVESEDPNSQKLQAANSLIKDNSRIIPQESSNGIEETPLLTSDLHYAYEIQDEMEGLERGGKTDMLQSVSTHGEALSSNLQKSQQNPEAMYNERGLYSMEVPQSGLLEKDKHFNVGSNEQWVRSGVVHKAILPKKVNYLPGLRNLKNNVNPFAWPNEHQSLDDLSPGETGSSENTGKRRIGHPSDFGRRKNNLEKWPIPLSNADIRNSAKSHYSGETAENLVKDSSQRQLQKEKQRVHIRTGRKLLEPTKDPSNDNVSEQPTPENTHSNDAEKTADASLMGGPSNVTTQYSTDEGIPPENVTTVETKMSNRPLSASNENMTVTTQESISSQDVSSQYATTTLSDFEASTETMITAEDGKTQQTITEQSLGNNQNMTLTNERSGETSAASMKTTTLEENNSIHTSNAQNHLSTEQFADNGGDTTKLPTTGFETSVGPEINRVTLNNVASHDFTTIDNVYQEMNSSNDSTGEDQSDGPTTQEYQQWSEGNSMHTKIGMNGGTSEASGLKGTGIGNFMETTEAVQTEMFGKTTKKSNGTHTKTARPPKGVIVVGSAPNQSGDPTSYTFITLFATVCVVCILAYIIFHNKKKIVGLIVEGKKKALVNRKGSGKPEYQRISKGSDKEQLHGVIVATPYSD